MDYLVKESELGKVANFCYAKSIRVEYKVFCLERYEEQISNFCKA